MSRAERPVHVAAARAVAGVEHRADGLCRCDPVRARDLEVPSRSVWLHRPLVEDPAAEPRASR